MSHAPPYSALFRLSEPSTDTGIRCTLEDSGVVGEPGVTALVGGAEESARITARYVGGSGYRDFIWTDRGEALVSDRIVRTLSVNMITGWGTTPVQLSTKTGGQRDDYSLLVVTGRSGPLDFTHSEPIQKITPAGRSRAALGLYFDRDVWDGSMIFRPEGARDILITERARAAFGHANVTNVEMQALDAIEVDSDAYERWLADSGSSVP